MRGPRYRFPDEVRSTTREIASRMVQDGAIPATPEQLDSWISKRPEVKESLERGGYNTAFTPHDLFPLLQVFIQRAGGPAPPVEVPTSAPRRPWIPALLVLSIAALIVVLIAVLG